MFGRQSGGPDFLHVEDAASAFLVALLENTKNSRASKRVASGRPIMVRATCFRENRQADGTSRT